MLGGRDSSVLAKEASDNSIHHSDQFLFVAMRHGNGKLMRDRVKGWKEDRSKSPNLRPVGRTTVYTDAPMKKVLLYIRP